jgi:hypothetical protein
MNRDIELLNRGILPDSLNFNSDKNHEFDIYKVAYNLRYKTTEYWESKFPDGFQNIPGFDRIIEKIAEDAISPLEEITLIQEESKKIINE